MAKRSKEFEWRQQGMIYALGIAKKDGITALEKEVKMRGFLGTPITVTKTERQNFIDQISQNLYSTTLTVFAMVLHDNWGFGKKTPSKIKAAV